MNWLIPEHDNKEIARQHSSGIRCYKLLLILRNIYKSFFYKSNMTVSNDVEMQTTSSVRVTHSSNRRMKKPWYVHSSLRCKYQNFLSTWRQIHGIRTCLDRMEHLPSTYFGAVFWILHGMRKRQNWSRSFKISNKSLHVLQIYIPCYENCSEPLRRYEMKPSKPHLTLLITLGNHTEEP